MYRCCICRKTSRPHQTRLVHVEYRDVPKVGSKRTRQEVAAEHPVCGTCLSSIDEVGLTATSAARRNLFAAKPERPKKFKLSRPAKSVFAGAKLTSSRVVTGPAPKPAAPPSVPATPSGHLNWLSSQE